MTPAPAALATPEGAPYRFEVSLDETGPGPHLAVTGPDPATGEAKTRAYRLAEWEQPAWVGLYDWLAADFGTRPPLVEAEPHPGPAPPLTPLLTRNLTPEIWYGYGDPCVARTAPGRYHLVATSNDAPGSFPILRSENLIDWSLSGFVFPPGAKPAWAADGLLVSDYWAPELHRVGDEWWVCYSARRPDRSLAVGIARSPSPEGPYQTAPQPLIAGGVIDAHLLVEPDRTLIFWKEDNNGLWPAALERLVRDRPQLIAALFPREADRRTFAFLAALQPWTASLPPMRAFFVHQVLIEAVTADLSGFRDRFAALAEAGRVPAGIADAVFTGLTTPVFAQAVSPDGARLIGERTPILQNDLLWEAHLIEGPWVWREGERWFLFYAGNDFSTPQYGIGVAVADDPLGPYRKQAAPLLRSCPDWIGPGHPSVAPGPDGRPHLFLHAYRPGEIGYKAFRALLSAPLVFEGDTVRIGEPLPG